MDWWLLLNILRVIVAIIIMGYASYHDIKTRTVSNSLWIILGLAAISIFECQIILDFGIDAFPYLIVLIPITCLFMSFLICDWVVDFEKRKLNDEWISMIIMSGFAFLYLFQINSYSINDISSLFGPIILFLLYFMFMNTLINYLENRIYLQIVNKVNAKQKPLKNKVDSTSNDVKTTKKTTGKTTQKPFRKTNQETSLKTTQEVTQEIPLKPDNRFSRVLFFSLFLFFVIVFLMEQTISTEIIRKIGLSFLILIPLILIPIYFLYHLNAKSIEKEKSSMDSEDEINLSNIKVSKEDEQFLRNLKQLNYLLSIGLIFFGFYLIIYYSLLIDTLNIIMIIFTLLIWLVMFYGFYNLGLPRGGADTKALMCLVLLFPLYPIFENITFKTSFYSLIIDHPEVGLAYIFPMAFTVLMNAAFIMLIYIICLFFYNISKRDITFPHAFLGYRLPLEQVSHKFVWPMERIVDGKRKLVAFPGQDIDLKDELRKLRKAGVKKTWVTPKIPFIIPMVLGVILTIVAGNLLFELILGFY